MLDKLPIEIIIYYIFKYLSLQDIKNIILLSKGYYNRITEYNNNYVNIPRYKNIILIYNNNNNNNNNFLIKYKIIKIIDNNITLLNLKKLNCIDTIETIIFDNVTININIYFEIIQLFSNLKHIEFIESTCIINLEKEIVNKILINLYKNIETITLNKTSDSIFKLFNTKCENLHTIIIINENYTWTGFSHEDFNNILKYNITATNIILKGIGTSSYFDNDDFNGNIEKLDTHNVSFHWYVGIRHPRNTFLKHHKETLKELRIHNLPEDFDGGRLLKYILEEMTLNIFYYKHIPLILNSQKQNITEIEANQYNITSIYELFRQFSSIKKFTFNLSNNNVSSNTIEEIINPQTNIFKNIEEFIINDTTSYNSLLGVFLGLLKNINKVKEITIISQDRNINILLEEWFKISNTNLEKIYLSTTVPRLIERCRIIKTYVPNLKEISLYNKNNEKIDDIFNNNVTVLNLK